MRSTKDLLPPQTHTEPEGPFQEKHGSEVGKSIDSLTTPLQNLNFFDSDVLNHGAHP